jgi:large subunit ribosomal protein L4
MSIEVSVKDASGKEKSKRKVSSDVLSTTVNSGVVHQVVRWQRAKKRSGSSSVQTRAEMSGGGAKPWKQKGTGRARAGSNTSPIWVGGGVAHGPKVRDYDFGINKKEKKAAIKAALTSRNEANKLHIIDDLGLNTISTKKAVAALRRLGVVQGAKALICLPSESVNEAKSFRNVPGVTMVSPSGLNTYDLLNADAVLMTSAAFDLVEARLGK